MGTYNARNVKVFVRRGEEWEPLMECTQATATVEFGPAEGEPVAALPVEKPAEPGREDFVEMGRRLARGAEAEKPEPIRRVARPGRNDFCPCYSGRKFKRCCMR